MSIFIWALHIPLQLFGIFFCSQEEPVRARMPVLFSEKAGSYIPYSHLPRRTVLYGLTDPSMYVRLRTTLGRVVVVVVFDAAAAVLLSQTRRCGIFLHGVNCLEKGDEPDQIERDVEDRMPTSIRRQTVGQWTDCVLDYLSIALINSLSADKHCSVLSNGRYSV
ncbi:hypothetical protein PHET_00100 [Paragonimus heterotremus]|uniref:Uncharacterized protein n=1 Tax=Paragonimus heterotremus TaxID=100268 RepID=A0A8J4X3T9_9TREM|nr:hypothetical protein PHET_00100 [Paragonimus heterotremus]